MPDHLSVSDEDEINFQAIEGETELTPLEIYGANLIEWAVDRHASDLFVSDSENTVIVSLRRLGKIEFVRHLARSYGRRLQGHLRVLAGADSGDTMRPVEGRGAILTPNGRTVDLRLSSIPTLYGQDVAIRLFDPINGMRSVESLGFEDCELKQIQKLIQRPAGLILVAGPGGSGKTSTLYATVHSLHDGTRKIHTLEDPIEHAIPGVMQSQVNFKIGLDFADLLSSVLRHSPDVIMIGEIRDARTAETAVRAGVSGQLVLATIHAKTAAEAIDSMMQYKTNPKFLASSLICVINQRLVRSLCQNCAKPLDVGDLNLSNRVLTRLGEKSPQLYRQVGCEDCFGTGFESLACVPEIMSIDRMLSDKIAGRCTANELEAYACEQGMLTIAELLAVRVAEGKTTAVEASRAISDPLLAELCLRSEHDSVS